MINECNECIDLLTKQFKLKVPNRQKEEFEKFGTMVIPTTAKKEYALYDSIQLNDMVQITSFDKNLTRITLNGTELDVIQRAKLFQG